MDIDIKVITDYGSQRQYLALSEFNRKRNKPMILIEKCEKSTRNGCHEIRTVGIQRTRTILSIFHYIFINIRQIHYTRVSPKNSTRIIMCKINLKLPEGVAKISSFMSQTVTTHKKPDCHQKLQISNCILTQPGVISNSVNAYENWAILHKGVLYNPVAKTLQETQA